jgi:hypothetical protein
MEGEEEESWVMDYLGKRLPHDMVRNTMRLLDTKDDPRGEPVVKVDRDHYETLTVKASSRRVKVVRRGDLWVCDSDGNTSDNPCSHVLMVRIHLGEIERPNTARKVRTKGKEGRDHATEARAWRIMPTKLPELLARLLADGLPVIEPPRAPRTGAGRPPTPLYPMLYQSIVRVAFRQSLRMAEGSMSAHREWNDYRPVSAARLSTFINDPASTEILEKFLALSTWPAKPFETLFHPDGTGLTQQRFSAYFDERYHRKKKKKKAKEPEAPAAPDGKPKHDDKARFHKWLYTEILWTYRYTMIAALHSEARGFGEAPWLIPLLERAALLLDVGELGGDKAYVAHYIFDYAARHGIDAQIKFKANTNPTAHQTNIRAFKGKYLESLIDRKGYAARANRRNNAETGNHAFKAILGDQVFSKGPGDPEKAKKADGAAQRNEILCMAIAYNLTRLVYLGLERGLEVDFKGGAEVLKGAKWVPLGVLHDQFRLSGEIRPEWRQKGKAQP